LLSLPFPGFARFIAGANGAPASPPGRWVLADNVTLTPTGAGAPGAAFVQTALNWMGQYGLWACLAAVVLGGMTYGFSTYAGNTYRAGHGRTVALSGAVGAVIIGLGPSIINLLFNAA
jgi:hypothetical protein